MAWKSFFNENKNKYFQSFAFYYIIIKYSFAYIPVAVLNSAYISAVSAISTILGVA
jgi:hypothetical protein